MARPQKRGMDYFPMDVNTNHTLDYLRMRFGLVGFGAVVRLWQRIYAENGYYMEADEDALGFFAEENRLNPEELDKIIAFAVRQGIFDEQLYKEEGILTSYEIQERYFSAVGRRSRVEADSRYFLLPAEECGANLCLDGVFVNRNTAETDVPACNNPQTKENNTKVNQIIQNQTIQDQTTQNQNILYINKSKPEETTEEKTETKCSSLQSKEALRLVGMFEKITGKKVKNKLLNLFLQALSTGIEPKNLEQLIYKAVKQHECEQYLTAKLENSLSDT